MALSIPEKLPRTQSCTATDTSVPPTEFDPLHPILHCQLQNHLSSSQTLSSWLCMPFSCGWSLVCASSVRLLPVMWNQRGWPLSLGQCWMREEDSQLLWPVALVRHGSPWDTCVTAHFHQAPPPEEEEASLGVLWKWESQERTRKLQGPQAMHYTRVGLLTGRCELLTYILTLPIFPEVRNGFNPHQAHGKSLKVSR